MQITAQKWNNCTVLDLNGRLVLGTDLIDLRNAVNEATGKNPAKIILNLAHVTYVDVRGIDELVSTLVYIKNRGGRLLLTNLPRMVRIMLDTAHLTKAFEVPTSKQPEMQISDNWYHSASCTNEKHCESTFHFFA